MDDTTVQSKPEPQDGDGPISWMTIAMIPVIGAIVALYQVDAPGRWEWFFSVPVELLLLFMFVWAAASRLFPERVKRLSQQPGAFRVFGVALTGVFFLAFLGLVYRLMWLAPWPDAWTLTPSSAQDEPAIVILLVVVMISLFIRGSHSAKATHDNALPYQNLRAAVASPERCQAIRTAIEALLADGERTWAKREGEIRGMFEGLPDDQRRAFLESMSAALFRSQLKRVQKVLGMLSEEHWRILFNSILEQAMTFAAEDIEPVPQAKGWAAVDLNAVGIAGGAATAVILVLDWLWGSFWFPFGAAVFIIAAVAAGVYVFGERWREMTRIDKALKEIALRPRDRLLVHALTENRARADLEQMLKLMDAWQADKKEG